MKRYLTLLSMLLISYANAEGTVHYNKGNVVVEGEQYSVVVDCSTGAPSIFTTKGILSPGIHEITVNDTAKYLIGTNTVYRNILDTYLILDQSNTFELNGYVLVLPPVEKSVCLQP